MSPLPPLPCAPRGNTYSHNAGDTVVGKIKEADDLGERIVRNQFPRPEHLGQVEHGRMKRINEPEMEGNLSRLSNAPPACCARTVSIAEILLNRRKGTFSSRTGDSGQRLQRG